MYFFPRRRRQKRQEKPGSTWKLRSWTRSWKETCRSWRWEAPWTPRGSTRRMTGTASPSISRWVSSSNLCGKFFSYQKFSLQNLYNDKCPVKPLSLCLSVMVCHVCWQVGTVVDNPVDFYHSRVPKKARKRTMVEELLADAEFRQ